MSAAENACCCDFVTANNDDWGAAPDPGICRMRANPEEQDEVRMAEATRSSVLAPGSALELLPSRALSSARGTRTVRRRYRRGQCHQLGRIDVLVAWSRLAEPRRPHEHAESPLCDREQNALRILRTHASLDNANTAFGDRRSAVTRNAEIVVPLARARRGPVWAGLDIHPRRNHLSNPRCCTPSTTHPEHNQSTLASCLSAPRRPPESQKREGCSLRLRTGGELKNGPRAG